MDLCSKKLHEMTPANSEIYERKRKGGGVYTATRCLACRMSRRSGEAEYSQTIDDRVSELQQLFSPFRTDRSWQDRAGCRFEDPEDYFPTTRYSYNSHYVRQIAQRNCSWCPVRKECLVDALADATVGIRGGMLLPGALVKWDHVPLLESLIKELDGVNA